MEEALKEYYLYAVENNSKDREPIDFVIRDKEKVWTEVRGDKPSTSRNDVEVECEHPAVEFDDDEHVGECPICGAWAYWHWEESADDGYTIKDKVVDTWEYPDEIGGIVGEHLKELEKNGRSV